MLKAVILDFDGVIVDSEGTTISLFTELLNKNLALDLTEEDFAKYAGLRFEDRIRKIAIEKEINVNETEIEKIMAEGRFKYFTEKLEHVKAFKGTKKLLDELKTKKIKLGVGTNGSRKTVMKILIKLGLIDYFTCIITGDDVKRLKPKPDIFLECAKGLDVNPDSCIVIEDSKAGVMAAKKAGMKVVAVTTTTNEERLKEADLTVKTINDLNHEKILNLV